MFSEVLATGQFAQGESQQINSQVSVTNTDRDSSIPATASVSSSSANLTSPAVKRPAVDLPVNPPKEKKTSADLMARAVEIFEKAEVTAEEEAQVILEEQFGQVLNEQQFIQAVDVVEKHARTFVGMKPERRRLWLDCKMNLER